MQYLTKISDKQSIECYYVILENFKSFHKSIPKTNISFNFYHLPSSTVLDRKKITITLFYEQLGSDLNPESCSYFQGFSGSKLLSDCLVI